MPQSMSIASSPNSRCSPSTSAKDCKSSSQSHKPTSQRSGSARKLYINQQADKQSSEIRANIEEASASKTMANLCKCKSPLIILTIASVLVLLIAAASIECHYGKRTQYHEQGLHGPKSYKFGYTTGDHKNPQERHEVSDGHGHVKGWYSFVDANGKYQVVHYEASKYGGFRVLSHKKPYNNGKRHYNS